MTAADIDAIYAAFMPLQIAKVVDFPYRLPALSTLSPRCAEGLKDRLLLGLSASGDGKAGTGRRRPGYAPDYWVATDDLAAGGRARGWRCRT